MVLINSGGTILVIISSMAAYYHRRFGCMLSISRIMQSDPLSLHFSASLILNLGCCRQPTVCRMFTQNFDVHVHQQGGVPDLIPEYLLGWPKCLLTPETYPNKPVSVVKVSDTCPCVVSCRQLGLEDEGVWIRSVPSSIGWATSTICCLQQAVNCEYGEARHKQ